MEPAAGLARAAPPPPSRLDRALDLLATLLRTLQVLSLVLIALGTSLLSLVVFAVAPVAVAPVVVLGLVAARSVASKTRAIADLIEDADDRSAQPRRGWRVVSRALVDRVLASVLAVGVETAMYVPAACAVVAVLAFAFGRNGIGTGVALVGVVIAVFVAAAYQMAKCVAEAWVERLLPKEAAPKGGGEAKPLLGTQEV